MRKNKISSNRIHLGVVVEKRMTKYLEFISVLRLSMKSFCIILLQLTLATISSILMAIWCFPKLNYYERIALTVLYADWVCARMHRRFSHRMTRRLVPIRNVINMRQKTVHLCTSFIRFCQFVMRIYCYFCDEIEKECSFNANVFFLHNFIVFVHILSRS